MNRVQATAGVTMGSKVMDSALVSEDTLVLTVVGVAMTRVHKVLHFVLLYN